jgi:hypothetical protein
VETNLCLFLQPDLCSNGRKQREQYEKDDQDKGIVSDQNDQLSQPRAVAQRVGLGSNLKRVKALLLQDRDVTRDLTGVRGPQEGIEEIETTDRLAA